MRHLINLDDLSQDQIMQILDHAKDFAGKSPDQLPQILKHKTIMNVFYEDSTRTRISFEIAGKRLGANVINFTTLGSAVVTKGESYIDTIMTLNAMGADAFVIRHKDENACDIARQYTACPILNAGAGKVEHPTQALLDAYTMLEAKGQLEDLNIAIIGDLKHSRVAGSNIRLLQKLGANVRLVSPPDLFGHGRDDTPYFDNIEDGIKDCDVVMCLRVQRERLEETQIVDPDAFHSQYGLNHDRIKLAKPNVVILHPQPMNRGVEITSELADDPKYSLLRRQVTNGVYVRMACLDILVNQQ